MSTIKKYLLSGRFAASLTLLWLSVFTFSVPSYALEVDDIVMVERVKHCRNKTFCNDVISRDEYEVWEDNKVTDQHQKKTFLARYSSPAKANVRHLVFLAAGQHFQEGNDSDVTGQDSGWYEHFDADGTLQLSSTIWQVGLPIEESLATDVLSADVFDDAETFAAGAFNHQYNQESDKDEKEDIVNAYFDWLRGKFDEQNLETIYLSSWPQPRWLSGGTFGAKI